MDVDTEKLIIATLKEILECQIEAQKHRTEILERVRIMEEKLSEFFEMVKESETVEEITNARSDLSQLEELILRGQNGSE